MERKTHRIRLDHVVDMIAWIKKIDRVSMINWNHSDLQAILMA